MESTFEPQPAWQQRAAQQSARAAEWRQIRALVIRFGVPPIDADDVAQEVALSLHRTATIQERAALVWIISHSRANDYQRRRGARRRAYAHALPLLRGHTAAPNGEGAVMERERIAILLRAVDALEQSDPALHEVVRLHMEGLSLFEIARAQGTPYGTAITRTRRARTALRETLQRWAAEDEGRTLRAALRRAERWH